MKKKVFRFSYFDYEVFKKHLLAAGDNESQLFALCSKSEGPGGITLICNKLIIPDQNELQNQSGASIEPSQEYQAIVYGLGYELRLSIVDIHTHPFSENPRFSSTDDYHGTKNAGYITEHFPSEVTMGMVVFGNDLNCFEACIWNRGKVCFEPVDRLEILGSPTKILCNGIVEAVTEHQPNILGMSALLTTTMVNMVKVIKALEAKGMRDKVKIMIGGAPITQNYSEQIAADGYSPDAASAVDKAKAFIN